MAQVLTNENMVEFIQTRQVPEFKAPEAPKDESAKPNSATDTAEPAKGDANGRERGPDGKFVKAEQSEEKSKPEEAAKAADDDDDTSNLSEAVKRKIDRLIAKKHRAMKEAEEFGRDEARRALAAEARADALQREIEALKGTKSGEGPAPASGDLKMPKQEDFKTVGEYADAMIEYKIEKRTREALAKAEKAKEQTEAEKTQAQANERAQTFAKRQAEFMKATPDYEDIVEGADFDVPNVAMQYMVESEYGPQLAYHLAKNPDVADRLRNLSPGRVLAELGKLETRFEKASEPAQSANGATRSVSKAPPPITPLEGKTTPVTKDPSQMTFAELRALREQQKREGKWRV